MNPKPETQSVDHAFYANYLIKSDECLRAAKESFSKGDWNAATICAIHSCISACDALCVFFLGKRHSGSYHNDAIILMVTIKSADEQLKRNALRLRNILNIKNMAEYEERLVHRSEAEKAMKDMERFLAFVRSRLPKP
jgi:HEPN domain-containing protein